MVHYAIGIEGKVIAARSSKSHATKIYTCAVVGLGCDGTWGVWSYHSSNVLAAKAASSYPATGLRIVPVMTTERRAKVGDDVLTLPTVAL